MGPAVEEDRELPVQCLHSHLHTNRTLDSLDTADRRPEKEIQVPSNVGLNGNGLAGLGGPKHGVRVRVRG